MKLVRAVSLISVGCLASAGGFWLGCGGDDSNPDAGNITPDSGGEEPSVDATNDTSPLDSSKADASIPLNCTSYCAAIVADCQDTNAQYLDMGTCLKMCAAIPVGALTDNSADTLGCRINQVTLAAKSAKNAVTHCPQAGPYGYGGCGDLCGDFCARYASQCGTNGYDGGPQCVPTCVGFASSDGGPLDTAIANTIECREYHLENAYAFDSGADGGTGPMGHCAHASASGGMLCQ